jgi:outer membrane immunogenic protein
MEAVMKKSTFLLGAAVAALTAGSAVAADMAVKAPRVAPIVAPVFSWTGCYIGVHGGGGATRSDFTDSFVSEGLGGRGGTASWGNGGLAGGQIGCNYQTGVLVMGIEGEGYWSGMKSRQEASSTFFSEGTVTETTTAEARNKWDYTVAGRIGVAYERAFIYGKAGWAWGNYDFTASFTEFGTGFSRSDTIFGSKTLNGPLFGIGVEYALTNNWTVKGEYNYINYGLSPVSLVETSCSNGACAVRPGTFSQSFSSEKHLFKFGVNYLFNVGGGPVVAKY